MRLSAAILSGGESRRMGRDKTWVRFDGKPLIQLAMGKVRALGVEEVSISGRVDRDYSALKCPVLFDLEPGLGPLSGNERGLREGTIAGTPRGLHPRSGFGLAASRGRAAAGRAPGLHAQGPQAAPPSDSGCAGRGAAGRALLATAGKHRVRERGGHVFGRHTRRLINPPSTTPLGCSCPKRHTPPCGHPSQEGTSNLRGCRSPLERGGAKRRGVLGT